MNDAEFRNLGVHVCTCVDIILLCALKLVLSVTWTTANWKEKRLHLIYMHLSRMNTDLSLRCSRIEWQYYMLLRVAMVIVCVETINVVIALYINIKIVMIFFI